MAISEYVFGQVLNRFQPLATQRQLQAAREWRNTPFREIWRTRWLIVGYGPIGQALAQRLRAFDATVDVVRRSDAPIETAARVGTADDLPRFLPDADVVVLACPLTAATRGMANAAFFAAVKKDAFLVNIARGGLVEAAALTAALDSGRLGHAILDVFEPEPGGGSRVLGAPGYHGDRPYVIRRQWRAGPLGSIIFGKHKSFRRRRGAWPGGRPAHLFGRLTPRREMGRPASPDRESNGRRDAAHVRFP